MTINKIPVTLIKGDGIGPEIVESVMTIVDALGSPVEWHIFEAGEKVYAEHGDPLLPELLESIRKTKIALKAPLTTPLEGGFRSANVRLREMFDLFANLRPGIGLIENSLQPNLDLMLIRENTEGLYVGVEHFIPIDGDPKAVAEASGIMTRSGCRKISKFAFDYAMKHNRKKITIVHKANILRALTGLFLETALMESEKYKDKIEINDCIVDNAAMQLVLDPSQFDIILTTNMFGDILSDEIAGLIGGLGIAPGANIGNEYAIFEAAHGSALDIAGKGIANPTALLLATAMLFDHVHRIQKGTLLRTAIRQVLNEDNIRTQDLGGHATTQEYTEAVVRRIKDK